MAKHWMVMLAACAAQAACSASPPPGRTPSGGYVSCTTDADCVLTTKAGCCACCAGAPRALPAGKLAEEERRCAAADCAACSERISCPEVPSASSYVARCERGTCAAAPR